MSVNEGKRSRCCLVTGTREEEGDGRGGGGDDEEPGVEGSSSGHGELKIGLQCVYGARNRSWLALKAANAILFQVITIVISKLCAC